MAKHGHEKKKKTKTLEGAESSAPNGAAAPRDSQENTQKSAQDAARTDGAAKADAAGKSKPKDLLRRPTRRRAGRENVEVTGLVVDAFGRRFTLESDGARTLVDLGRRGAALASVTAGARVTVVGRRKNGELKAWTLRDEADGRTRALRKEKRLKNMAAPAAASEAAPAQTDAPASA